MMYFPDEPEEPRNMESVLDFYTRPDYDMVRWERLAAKLPTPTPAGPSPLTIQERYKALFQETQACTLKLVTFYKAKGAWTQECERALVSIVKQLQRVCQTLANPPIELSKDITNGTRSTGEAGHSENNPQSA